MSDVPLIAYVLLAGYVLITAVTAFATRTNTFKLAVILVALLATVNALALIGACEDDCSSAAGAGSVIIVFFGYIPTLLACAVGRQARRRVMRSGNTDSRTETT